MKVIQIAMSRIFYMVAMLSLCSMQASSCTTSKEVNNSVHEGDRIPVNASGRYDVAPVFSNGMVLQRNADVRIFGTADKGCPVTVKGSWSRDSVTVYPFKDGRYVATLKTPEAGGPYTLSVNDSLFTDVLIGEVWVCSGQSNMHFSLAQARFNGVNGENRPEVRTFRVPVSLSDTLARNTYGGEWLYGKTNDIGGRVSAVGYYFARKLNMELGVPVGLLTATQGGTAAEEWMSQSVFDSMPESVKREFSPTETKWPGCRFNSMIYPLFPYTVAGTIWYQGENNWNRVEGYHHLLPALIEEWREGFCNDKMPFYLVQLSAFTTKWMEMREMQEKIADETDFSGYVPTIDVGERDIHPKNKRPVGERLAEIALSRHYNKDGFRNEGPRYASHRTVGNRISVFFRNVGDRLILKDGGTSPLHFEICGADGVYYPAESSLENDVVTLWSEQVTIPKDVRYFWTGYAVPNLFSSDGWPVAQFRTR